MKIFQLNTSRQYSGYYTYVLRRPPGLEDSRRSEAAQSREKTNGRKVNGCCRPYKMVSVLPDEPLTDLQNRICEMSGTCLHVLEFCVVK